VNRGKLLHEGKAKQVFATDNPDAVLVYFKDDATAFDGKKRGEITQKGEVNTRLSAIFFRHLEGSGVPNHFIEEVGPREMLARSLEIIPVEVVVRNVAAGSLAKRLGLNEGTPLGKTVLEFYYKSDELGDPLINRYHIAALELCTPDQLEIMATQAFRVNDILSDLLEPVGLKLIDFKLEFGTHKGEVILGDEISPDTCRFWDIETGERLDKDRFRRDLGGVTEAYVEVLRRVTRAVGAKD